MIWKIVIGYLVSGGLPRGVIRWTEA